jgi:hypothetical protein
MRTALGVFVSSVSILVFSAIAAAQQDVVVDPTHHKLEFENNCVRVVRAKFGSGEKSAALFDAKDAVIVEVTGSEGFKVTFPDGKSVTTPGNDPGQVSWQPGGRIQPENIGNRPVEYIVIEPKGCN